MKKFFLIVGLVIISLFVFISCEKQEGNIGKYRGHEYVDLGLSVKWATCNVGASKPWKYGDYFAWGEVEIKDYYNANYKYYDGEKFTKYSDGVNCMLEPGDDAATVNWGGSWRMPTVEEQKELINNCTWICTTDHDVAGYRVISKVEGYTDQSIFLPAGGAILADRNSGSLDGLYWSNENNCFGGAYLMSFNPDTVGIYFTSPFFGLSVRPVYQ